MTTDQEEIAWGLKEILFLLADKAHMAVKREAVQQLPRLWSLKRLLGLAEVTPQKTEPAMVHLSTAHASGSPADFTPPPGNLHINLDHPYLRQSDERSSARAAAGSMGQHRASTCTIPSLKNSDDYLLSCFQL